VTIYDPLPSASSTSPFHEGTYTTTVTANVPAPVTSTGFPTCAPCSTSVTVYVPGPSTLSFFPSNPGIYTTTITMDVTTPVTSTGTPACAACSTPVTVYQPSSSSNVPRHPGIYTTTITTDVLKPVTSTGKSVCATCLTPVVVYDPSVSSSASSTPGTYMITVTANITKPLTSTGKPTCITCATPVTVYNSPSSGPVSPTAEFYTTTVTANVTRPLTSTGTPTCATCSTPVTVYDPPIRVGTYTTTVTSSGITAPVTSTGTPSCASCSTPVTVYDTPAGPYTTTVTGNVTAPVTSTGRPTCATCSTPVTVYDPSTSSTPSGTISSTIPTITPDASCNNRGLAYAVYNNAYTNVYSQTEPYASYNVTYFQTAPVEYQNTTTHLGYSVASGGHSQVYGKGPVFPASNITINHRGYLYAKESGNYTFSAPSVDDILLLWLGAHAYNDYTRSNADLVQNYINPRDGSSATTYTVYLKANTYTAFRFMFANAQGKGDYALRLTAPDGSAIIDGTTTQQSPYLVKYSCDCSAPPFPAFGNDGPGSTADTSVYSCPSGSSPGPSPSPSTVTSLTTIPPSQPGYTTTVPQSGTVSSVPLPLSQHTPPRLLQEQDAAHTLLLAHPPRLEIPYL
jgi:hypothetical protein